jgi:hypothetical protein
MACVLYAIVGCTVMYAIVCTQKIIFHVVGVFNRYMSTLEKEYWTYFKRLFKHLHGTIKYTICYQGNTKTVREVNVHGFVDID